MTFITRFAPSPTGPLHLGHAYSALLAFDLAQERNGQFLLRIEDIDRARSKPEWESQIYDDLAWLGITWKKPVLRQSLRLDAYEAALKRLWSDGQLFACSCNRRDILGALTAPQEGDPPIGPDGPVYPGTCRGKDSAILPEPPTGTALRLSMDKVVEAIEADSDLGFWEEEFGDARFVEIKRSKLIENVGDVVLSRKDMGTSYHLSVVLDDAFQGVTDVVRGEDLFEATQIHVILQHLLGLPTPKYLHHRLIRDEAGKRLAKRDDARAIWKYREDGLTPLDVRKMVGLVP